MHPSDDTDTFSSLLAALNTASTSLEELAVPLYTTLQEVSLIRSIRLPFHWSERLLLQLRHLRTEAVLLLQTILHTDQMLFHNVIF